MRHPQWVALLTLACACAAPRPSVRRFDLETGQLVEPGPQQAPKAFEATSPRPRYVLAEIGCQEATREPHFWSSHIVQAYDLTLESRAGRFYRTVIVDNQGACVLIEADAQGKVTSTADLLQERKRGDAGLWQPVATPLLVDPNDTVVLQVEERVIRGKLLEFFAALQEALANTAGRVVGGVAGDALEPTAHDVVSGLGALLLPKEARPGRTVPISSPQQCQAAPSLCQNVLGDDQGFIITSGEEGVGALTVEHGEVQSADQAVVFVRLRRTAFPEVLLSGACRAALSQRPWETRASVAESCKLDGWLAEEQQQRFRVLAEALDQLKPELGDAQRGNAAVALQEAYASSCGNGAAQLPEQEGPCKFAKATLDSLSDELRLGKALAALEQALMNARRIPSNGTLDSLMKYRSSVLAALRAFRDAGPESAQCRLDEQELAQPLSCTVKEANALAKQAGAELADRSDAVRRSTLCAKRGSTPALQMVTDAICKQGVLTAPLALDTEYLLRPFRGHAYGTVEDPLNAQSSEQLPRQLAALSVPEGAVDLPASAAWRLQLQGLGTQLGQLYRDYRGARENSEEFARGERASISARAEELGQRLGLLGDRCPPELRQRLEEHQRQAKNLQDLLPELFRAEPNRLVAQDNQAERVRRDRIALYELLGDDLEKLKGLEQAPTPPAQLAQPLPSERKAVPAS